MERVESLKAKLQFTAELIGSLKKSVVRARHRLSNLRKRCKTTPNPSSRTYKELANAEAAEKSSTKRLQMAQAKFDALFRLISGAGKKGPPQGLKVRQLTIAKFDAVKRVLKAAQEKFNALQKVVCPRQYRPGSQELITALLAREPDRTWSLCDIAAKLPLIPPGTIRAHLYELKRKRKCKKVSRDAWKAVVVGRG